MADATPNVLFLDDMETRHAEFMHRAAPMDVRVWQARSAYEAISLLDSIEFDQVFLDHDLSEEDIMVPPGEPTKVPTGMKVVDHIVRMERPPGHVVVHTLNPPAAEAMCLRLASRQGIRVDRIPFSIVVMMMGGPDRET
jgi:hypothetical protein